MGLLCFNWVGFLTGVLAAHQLTLIPVVAPHFLDIRPQPRALAPEAPLKAAAKTPYM